MWSAAVPLDGTAIIVGPPAPEGDVTSQGKRRNRLLIVAVGMIGAIAVNDGHIGEGFNGQPETASKTSGRINSCCKRGLGRGHEGSAGSHGVLGSPLPRTYQLNYKVQVNCKVQACEWTSKGGSVLM